MSRRSGLHTPRINLVTFSRYWEAYNREKEHFVDAVLSKGKVCISGKMVAAVFKICAACETSGRSGKPVDIEWKGEEIPEEYGAMKC